MACGIEDLIFMAWFEVDIYRKCVEVDLHDYSHRTAIAASREKIKEAYEHGFKYIRLIHGAANIRIKRTEAASNSPFTPF
jgi:hypothetical protein